MPNLNILRQALRFPIQAVLQVGKAGDGYNAYRAPSQVAYFVGDVPGGGVVTLVPAVANRSLRIFKYFLSTVNPGVLGVNVTIRTRWGNPPVANFIYHQAPGLIAGVGAVGFWTVDLSPCGVTYAPGIAFALSNDNVFINGVSAVVLYSTEAWGAASGSDGSDIG
jgi:hypothetical protein